MSKSVATKAPRTVLGTSIAALISFAAALIMLSMLVGDIISNDTDSSASTVVLMIAQIFAGVCFTKAHRLTLRQEC